MFGRKPKLGVDDIREIIAELSDDERKELFNSFSGKGNDSAEEEDDKTDGGEDAGQDEPAEEAAEESKADEDGGAADDAEESESAADGAEEAGAESAEDIAEEESAAEGQSTDAQDAEQDMEQKTALEELTEAVTKLEARIAALEHANDRDGEEIGVDDDFTDALAPAMPQSYLDKAKAMRY